MSAAVVSTSVMGSAATMIHDGQGSACRAASARLASRERPGVSEDNGASKRKITQPGQHGRSG